MFPVLSFGGKPVSTSDGERALVPEKVAELCDFFDAPGGVESEGRRDVPLTKEELDLAIKYLTGADGGLEGGTEGGAEGGAEEGGADGGSEGGAEGGVSRVRKAGLPGLLRSLYYLGCKEAAYAHIEQAIASSLDRRLQGQGVGDDMTNLERSRKELKIFANPNDEIQPNDPFQSFYTKPDPATKWPEDNLFEFLGSTQDTVISVLSRCKIATLRTIHSYSKKWAKFVYDTVNTKTWRKRNLEIFMKDSSASRRLGLPGLCPLERLSWSELDTLLPKNGQEVISDLEEHGLLNVRGLLGQEELTMPDIEKHIRDKESDIGDFAYRKVALVALLAVKWNTNLKRMTLDALKRGMHDYRLQRWDSHELLDWIPVFSTEALNSSSLEYLSFGGWELPVQDLKGQEHLDLSGDGDGAAIFAEDGMLPAFVIAESLRKNLIMKTLHLRHRQLGRLRTGLSGPLTNNAGVAAMAQALSEHPALTDLDLENNSIAEPGAAAIKDALETNETLRFLNLSHNHIGDPAGDFAGILHKLEVCNLLFTGLGEDVAEKLATDAGQNSEGCSLAGIRSTTTEMCLSRLKRADAILLASDLTLPSVCTALTRLVIKVSYIDDISEIAKALVANTAVKVLELHFCPPGTGGLEAFCEALGKNHTLKRMSLKWCEIRPIEGDAIGEALKSTHLKHLDLTGNKLAKGAGKIAEALRENQHLKSLILNDNEIDDQTGWDFAKALHPAGNTSLENLDLHGNYLKEEILAAIEKALETNRLARAHEIL